MPLVRMRSPAKDVTEVNFSQWGIYHPDSEGVFMIPAEAISEAQKASLELAPLSPAELLRRVSDAIGALADGAMKTALFAAITSTQLLVSHDMQSYT